MPEPIKSTNAYFKSAGALYRFFNSARAKNGVLSGYNDGDQERRGQAGADILVNGTLNNVERAYALTEKIVADVETPRQEWALSVTGGFPDVPAFIAGLPENMWQYTPTTSSKAPLHVYIGLSSEWNITDEQLATRGAALAAFALAMSNVRPIILTPWVALSGWPETQDKDGNVVHNRYSSYRSRRRYGDLPPAGSKYVAAPRAVVVSWDIPTTPLMMSELMSISVSDVTRYFGIEVCQHISGKRANGDGAFHPDSRSEEAMRKHLRCEPDALYLPQITYRDPYLSDPVKWVNTLVERYTSEGTTDRDDIDLYGDKSRERGF